MWVFMINSFLSIVEDREDPNLLLVRARFPDDINRIFPDAVLFRKPNSDYRYRALIPRAEVVKAIAGQIENIHYDNFKNTVSEPDRHDAYFDVWGDMERAQQEYKDKKRAL